MNHKVYDLLVLGAGPAGLTAALYGHRAGLEVFVLGGETPGGQVTLHYRVENYPGFPGGVAGAELMMRWMKQVMDEIGSMPQPESVTGVDFSGPVKKVFTTTEEHLGRTVIVATGATSRRLNVPGEVELEGHGVFYCATCDAPLLRTMARSRAAVVGGGDSALHTALALLPHAESVTLVTRGAELRAKPVLVRRLEQNPNVNILLGRTVKAVVGRERLSALTLENVSTGQSETLPLEAVFVGVGQAPASGFLKGSLELDKEGFIVTDSMLQTSVPGVFGAGDVRVTPLRQILTAAADGALAAQAAADYLRTVQREQ